MTLVVTIPVSAQNTDTTNTSAVLQEVVVTARKREEPLQDVPLTITALTAETLAAAGVRDVKQLSNLTPGFHFENPGGRQNSQPRIRGMDINTANPTRQNASFFVDGVYMPGSTQTLDFSEFERIEVIKGPQSALFGRQTFGGAVNFVSKDPGEELGFDVVGTAGTAGLEEYSASLSGPIIADKLYGRVHLRSYEFDGRYRNSLNNERLGAQQSRSGSAVLVWKPLDTLRFDLRYMRQSDDDGPAAILQLGASQLNCGPFGGTFRFYCGKLPTSGTYRANTVVGTNAAGIDAFGYERDSETLSLKGAWSVGGHEIALIGSRFEENSLDVSDADLTGSPVFGTASYQDFSDRSFELRVSSAGDGPFRYVAGVFWYEGEFLSNAYFTGATLTTVPAPAAQIRDIAEAKNRAAFASVGYDFSDRLRGSVELRYQQDEVVNVSGSGVNRRTLSGETKAWLPRVILDYKITDDVMLYGVVSEGNKPKQFNANIAARSATEQAYILQTYGVGVALDEETLRNYELGLKSTWLDRRALLNVAMFKMDWQDQVTRRQVFPSPTSTTQIDAVANAGSTEIKGIELEGKFSVTRAFGLEATAGLIDAQYTSFNSVNVQQVFGNPETKGREAPRFPKVQGSLSATYTLPVFGEWDATFRLDQLYKGKRWTDEVNLAYAGAYSRTNIRATLARGPFSATAYVENLTDDDGVESATRFRDITVPGNNFSFPYSLSEGMKVGVTLRYSL
ncbi:MAG TPA: TonB-dependent receptor [Steroidobacteraceae bacterium]|nr:TonB-dependent receptor [Steroidobacteraceae bacterium]